MGDTMPSTANADVQLMVRGTGVPRGTRTLSYSEEHPFQRIGRRIAARFGSSFVWAVLRLPFLPISRLGNGLAYVRTVIEGWRVRRDELIFLRSVLRSTSDAVVIADGRATVIQVNLGAEKLLGLHAHDMLGQNLFRLCVDDAEQRDRVASLLREKQAVENERMTVRTSDGQAVPVLITINFVKDEHGRDVAIVAILKDNSETERLVAELDRKKAEFEKLARTDSLTEVANRRHFDEVLDAEYERLGRGLYRDGLSLLFIDIDHFKDINTEHGYAAGNDVLTGIGRLLKDQARAVDFVARYGGEEFAVILPGTSREGAHRVADRLREAIKKMETRSDNGRCVSVTASIGVQTHGQRDGNETGRQNAMDLVDEAGTANRLAKKMGRDRIVIYSDSTYRQIRQ